MVQSKNDYFHELEKSQVIINEELGEDLIVKLKSKKGDLWNIHAKWEVNIENENKWNEYAKWQIDTIIKFLKVFPKYKKIVRR